MRKEAISWWDMPGPQRFVGDIAADLEAGRHVVVGLPPHTPSQLLNHLIHYSQPGLDIRSWQYVSPPQLADDQSPAEWMWHYWKQGQDDPCPFDLTPQELARRTDLPVGKRVVLSNLLPVDWQKWWDFLWDYASQAQQTNSLRRNLFCLLVEDPAVLACLPTKQESQFRVHCYDGRCSRLDMQLYVAAHNGGSTSDAPLTLIEEIRQELAALLFQTDPDAALEVAKLPTPEAFALQSIVENVATKRQWSTDVHKITAGTAVEWAHGWIDQRHPRAWRHPGAPHAIAPHQRAEMALWQAQVRVLLPWIEQRRRELLCEQPVRTFLKGKLPHQFERDWKTTQAELHYTKDQVDSLELGFILELFSEKWDKMDAGQKASIRKFKALKAGRDNLSHLKPMSWQEIEALLDI